MKARGRGAWLLLLSGAVTLAAAWASAARGAHSGPARPILPNGATYVEASASPLAWDGWIPLTPTLRPPTSLDGKRRIVVYLRLPPSARIDVGPSHELRLPAGTESVRVELDADTGDLDAAPNQRWRVLDVRGTRMRASGVEYTMLRPTRDSANLLGFSWDPADVDTRASAGALVRSGLLLGKSDETAARHLEDLHDCAGCHRPARRESPSGVVHRGTDTQGFFGLRSVFEDLGPLETYRPRNANAGDAYVQPVPRDGTEQPGPPWRARLNVPAGLRAGDRHVAQVCASRAAVARAFTDEARRAYDASLRDCAIVFPPRAIAPLGK